MDQPAEMHMMQYNSAFRLDPNAEVKVVAHGADTRCQLITIHSCEFEPQATKLGHLAPTEAAPHYRALFKALGMANIPLARTTHKSVQQYSGQTCVAKPTCFILERVECGGSEFIIRLWFIMNTAEDVLLRNIQNTCSMAFGDPGNKGFWSQQQYAGSAAGAASKRRKRKTGGPTEEEHEISVKKIRDAIQYLNADLSSTVSGRTQDFLCGTPANTNPWSFSKMFSAARSFERRTPATVEFPFNDLNLYVSRNPATSEMVFSIPDAPPNGRPRYQPILIDESVFLTGLEEISLPHAICQSVSLQVYQEAEAQLQRELPGYQNADLRHGVEFRLANRSKQVAEEDVNLPVLDVLANSQRKIQAEHEALLMAKANTLTAEGIEVLSYALKEIEYQQLLRDFLIFIGNADRGGVNIADAFLAVIKHMEGLEDRAIDTFAFEVTNDISSSGMAFAFLNQSYATVMTQINVEHFAALFTSAMNAARVCNGPRFGHLIYTGPMSGGKTTVADRLMLATIPGTAENRDYASALAMTGHADPTRPESENHRVVMAMEVPASALGPTDSRHSGDAAANPSEALLRNVTTGGTLGADNFYFDDDHNRRRKKTETRWASTIVFGTNSVDNMLGPTASRFSIREVLPDPRMADTQGTMKALTETADFKSTCETLKKIQGWVYLVELHIGANMLADVTMSVFHSMKTTIRRVIAQKGMQADTGFEARMFDQMAVCTRTLTIAQACVRAFSLSCRQREIIANAESRLTDNSKNDDIYEREMRDCLDLCTDFKTAVQNNEEFEPRQYEQIREALKYPFKSTMFTSKARFSLSQVRRVAPLLQASHQEVIMAANFVIDKMQPGKGNLIDFFNHIVKDPTHPLRVDGDQHGLSDRYVYMSLGKKTSDIRNLFGKKTHEDPVGRLLDGQSYIDNTFGVYLENMFKREQLYITQKEVVQFLAKTQSLRNREFVEQEERAELLIVGRGSIICIHKDFPKVFTNNWTLLHRLISSHSNHFTRPATYLLAAPMKDAPSYLSSVGVDTRQNHYNVIPNPAFKSQSADAEIAAAMTNYKTLKQKVAAQRKRTLDTIEEANEEEAMLKQVTAPPSYVFTAPAHQKSITVDFDETTKSREQNRLNQRMYIPRSHLAHRWTYKTQFSETNRRVAYPRDLMKSE